MTAISVEVDNEYFMVKVESIEGAISSQALVKVYSPDQARKYYTEKIIFEAHGASKQFELDFDKRDAKKVTKRYLKFR